MSIEVFCDERYKLLRVTDTRPVIPVMPLGDMHIGADTCLEKMISETLDYVKKNDIYLLLMGDLIENASKYSIGGGVYSQKHGINEQIKMIVDMLSPVKNRIIGAVKGNHEDRLYKIMGFDVTMTMMTLIGIPERYCGPEGFFVIRTDRSVKKYSNAYSGYFNHSLMGNKTGGLALNATQRDIAASLGVDVIIRGHNHKRNDDAFVRISVDPNNMAIQEREIVMVNSGHFLDRAQSYAASVPYAGTRPGPVLMKFDMGHGRHQISVEKVNL